MKFTFLNADHQRVHEADVSPAFLHVLLDFELASTRYNGGKPIQIHFNHIDSFYELINSRPQPTDFGGAKSTLLGDPEAGEISVSIFTPFGEGQEALIAHEIAHMYLLALGYPVTMPPEGTTPLASGISNIGSHWPLNHYLRSCGIDVDADNERRVRNMATYLSKIDFSDTYTDRLSLDFADMLIYVSDKTRREIDTVIRSKASNIFKLVVEIRAIVESIPELDRSYPYGSQQIMQKLCELFPDADGYAIRKDIFNSFFI